MTVQIKLRRDTAANWTSVNPTLAVGEPGLETDTLKVKYGDGLNPWVNLPYPTNYATVAAAGTLTGTTLAPNVYASSLTSVGTLVNLTVTNPINGSISGNAATASVATAINGGISNQIPYQSGANTTAFIAVPATPNTYLSWTGSGFTWAAPSASAAAGLLTGTTLASNVVTSNLTTLGNLTGLTSSGQVNVTATTVSSASNTGALVVAGGTGIGGALNVAGTTGLAGVVSITNSTNSTASTNGALVVTGGVGIAGNTYIQGNLVVAGNITDTAGNVIVQAGNLTVSGSATVGGINTKSLSIAMAAALS